MSNWNQQSAMGCSEYSSPSTTERQLDVVRWIEQLGYATGRLAALADGLESRLAPALGPELTGNEKQAKPLPPTCTLANEIQSRVESLEAIEARISSILRRLEF